MYKGVIIEESLSDKSVIKNLIIIESNKEKVTEKHKTPWLKQWTLDTVEIEDQNADTVAKLISKSFDVSHKGSWYADFKNEQTHYIIFPGKIFKIERTHSEQYKQAADYGISLGIPEYQVDFSPYVNKWER